MANETLTFSCPACGIKLTVPSQLAGVTGPCPSCGTQIQAPYPAAPAPEPPSHPAVPLSGELPAPAPVVQSPTVPYSPVQCSGIPMAPAVKPEPRHLPNRPHAEVVAKQMPEPRSTGSSAMHKAEPHPRHPPKARPFVRFVMLAIFLIASGALVFGVLTLLKWQTKKDAPPVRTAPPSTAGERVKAEPAAPAPEENPEPDSLPTPAPEQPTLMEPAPELPDGIPPKAPGMEAYAVLEKFLVAKSLEERLPMIETKTPPGELAMSCLAGPLPPAPKMLLEYQESNPLEEVVDFYYSVDFATKDRHLNPQTILVRIRGRGAPKVVVDPFLDLFGGRLAAYAARPTDEAGVFEVIVSALATCTDATVPNREKKLTLKLLARENTKAIAEAYFGKMSRIGEMLEDGTYSLSYGNAKACTVMLRWNTEDDVNHPYLEAITIKTLNWNP